MTAVKTTSTFVLVRDDHDFKGAADVDCPCLHHCHCLCFNAIADVFDDFPQEPWSSIKQADIPAVLH